jgi:hypothetical protein
VAQQDFGRFVASLLATFGGTATKQGVFSVTPTPSSTMSQLVMTPAGTFSVFGFKTPIPFPFGAERTGYLVTDLDAATDAARAAGADVLVSPFNDPIGRDAIVQRRGGVNGCSERKMDGRLVAVAERPPFLAYNFRALGVSLDRARL